MQRDYFEFMNNAKTSDILYINDSTYYLMNRSPLEIFPKYKNLYDGYKEITFVLLKLVYGSQIPPDETTKFFICWFLKDNRIYLSDIHFFSVGLNGLDTIFPNNEQYKLMEKMTGVKFNSKYKNHTDHRYDPQIVNRSNKAVLVNPYGTMPATWFNGVIIVKIAAKYGGDYDKWNNTPCKELTFKKGKLVKTHMLDMY